jgi:hypothetical protein
VIDFFQTQDVVHGFVIKHCILWISQKKRFNTILFVIKIQAASFGCEKGDYIPRPMGFIAPIGARPSDNLRIVMI